jgi:hypothetical protein
VFALSFTIRTAVAVVCAQVIVAGDVIGQASQAAARDDAAVYGAVFERLYRGSAVDARPIVLQDSLHALKTVVSSALRESLLRIEGVHASTVTDFLTVSAEGMSLRELAPRIRSSRPVMLGRVSDFGPAQEGPAAFWERFNARFPDSYGLVSVSRVGYSQSGEQALVMTNHGCSPQCGIGHVVVLRRVNGAWEVVRAQVTVEV